MRPLFRLFFVVMTLGGLFSSAGRVTTPVPANLPSGVEIERLTEIPRLPFGHPELSSGLARYTIQPGAEVDLPYAGPILLYVDQGALSLAAVGGQVSITYPADEQSVAIRTDAKDVTVRQEAEAPPRGANVLVLVGGSAFALDGDIGSMRNAGDEPLVLLVVTFVVQPAATDADVVATEAPPDPTATP